MTVAVEQKKTWPELRYKLASGAGSAEVHRLGATNIACLFFAALLFVVSVSCTCLLWFTGIFETVVHSSMLYSEGSEFFQGWLAPPFGPTTKLYLYNYTNVDDFMAGRAKRLRVQELGPYAYSETLKHVDVHFHPNDTMSYTEEREFTFHPEWSRGSPDDVIVVPNLPMICAIARVRDEPYVAQLGLRSALWASGGATFTKLVVRDYLFGYNDTLYTMAKSAVEMATSGTLPKLGMLAPRVGRSTNVYTVNTGRGDYNLQDTVTRLNGRADLGAWKDAKCNSIHGSAGTFFPASAARGRLPVHLVNADICRRIPLEFKKEVTVMDGIPALRYGPPDDFLDNGEHNPSNLCYTTDSYSKSKVPSGVLLNGPCFMDSPNFISFPRFYLGDPKLREAVDGMLEPVKEQHEMFFDVHPELGVTLGATTRLQVNVMVRKAELISGYLDNFVDETILPILWFETVLTEFPEDVKRATYHATFTVRTLERAARYGLPVMALACLAILCHQLAVLAHRYRLGRRHHHQPLPVEVVRVS